ncbi:MAG: endonuclease/exonuclease/phosphatase family protein [Vulcanimicrobiota bacterium]
MLLNTAQVKRFDSAPNYKVYRGAGASARESQDVDQVTIGTYNVKNLFDGIDQDPSRGTTEKPDRELRALAAVIANSKADVVALQEVENIDVLNKFLQDFMPEQFQHAVLVEGNDGRGIDVAVISKFDITNVVSHKENRFPKPDGSGQTDFSRDLLRVDLQVGQYPLSVYTTHLKSKRGGEESTVQRQAEANEVRRILEQEMGNFEGKNFVVTGDLNDSPMANTTKTIREGEPGHPRLIDGLDGKPWNQRDTWPSDRPRRQIDFIMFPEHMADNLVKQEVQHHSQASTASDHMMVAATFNLRDEA